ncbi:hypothetical protein BSKO_10868 [Bryopsis sp. KO-2023]|nr:hypothetical protein BSKO_10868 [Bryopsis sp. KO-2023]
MDSTVVVDYGSDTLKAGLVVNFPSEQEPAVVTPSVVVAPDGSRRTAVSHGQVEDWDALESLLYYSVYDRLKWKQGEEGQLLVCEPLFTPRADRERLTQILFEMCNSTGVFLQDSAVLSLYAVGRLTGCVLDLGHGKIDIAPVSEGQLQTHAVTRLDICGQDLTQCLQQKIGLESAVQISIDDAKIIKENSACVAASSETFLELQQEKNASDNTCSKPPSPVKHPGSPAQKPSVIAPGPGVSPQLCLPPTITEHVLPDGNTIHVKAGTAAILGESLFNPSVVGRGGPGLADACCECVLGQGDPSLRKQLVESLLVCGGGSGMLNLTHRMFNELQTRLPPSLQVGICGAPEYMPEKTLQFAQWMGGAILSKVATQHGHFVSKGEYDEIGPGAVHRKC